MIRLTLILIAGLFATMLIFGNEDPSLQTAEIEERVLPNSPVVETREEVSAPITPVVQEIAAPVVEPVAEPQVEVTQRDSIDLNTVPQNAKPRDSGLIIVESNDAPADALPLNPPAALTPELAVGAQKLLIVTGNRVNLRAGPSTNQAVVTQLGRGDRAELLTNTPDGWVQIRHMDTGRIGYMSADFLTPANPG